jgi:NAD(P)-dependent dehydrogenase (short-subunit alcohol dehydrogenase family)
MSKKTYNEARRQFLGQMAMTAGIASVAAFDPRNADAQAPAAPASAPGPAPLKDVAGKVAFITGGSSGIGLGQARVFHEAGMKVVIGYIRDDQVGPALDQFKTDKDRVHAIKVNVTDRAAMRAAADEVEAHFGRIHLVSNNAGIGLLTSLSAVDYQDFDQTIAVNLVGVFNGVHEFLPRIRKHGEGGHIITTSSMSGILPTEGGGAGIYTTTKFAVVGMMEALRSEMDTLKANVGVSVYCPGLVSTNIFEVEQNLRASFKENGSAAKADGPEAAAFATRMRGIIASGMSPLEAGRYVLNGIRNNDLFILSHPEFLQGLQERHAVIQASVARGKAPVERTNMVKSTLRNSVYTRELAKLGKRRKA